MTTTRAERVDLVIETSASFVHEFRRAVAADPPVPIESLVDGDLVWHEGEAWPVRSTVTRHDRVLVELGVGLYTDPSIVADVGRLVQKVDFATPSVAVAAFAVPESVATPAPTTWKLPTRLDGDRVLVELTADQTTALAELVDGVAEESWGPSGFVAPWDLIVEYDDGATVRIAEGSMIVIRSTSTSAVEIPTTP